MDNTHFIMHTKQDIILLSYLPSYCDLKEVLLWAHSAFMKSSMPILRNLKSIRSSWWLQAHRKSCSLFPLTLSVLQFLLSFFLYNSLFMLLLSLYLWKSSKAKKYSKIDLFCSLEQVTYIVVQSNCLLRLRTPHSP